MQKVSRELRERWLPFGGERRFGFRLSNVLQGFRRQVLPVATGGDLCGVLKRSGDGWMRLPVCGPNQRAVVNILSAQILELIATDHAHVDSRGHQKL